LGEGGIPLGDEETNDFGGYIIENHNARLMLNAEVIYTYEGRDEVNLLLVGRELTGLNAFV